MYSSLKSSKISWLHKKGSSFSLEASLAFTRMDTLVVDFKQFYYHYNANHFKEPGDFVV
jgi:hypothetical protein